MDPSQSSLASSPVRAGTKPEVGGTLQLLRTAEQRTVAEQLLRLDDSMRFQMAQSAGRETDQFQLDPVQHGSTEVAGGSTPDHGEAA